MKTLLVVDIPEGAKLVGVACDKNGPPLYGVGYVPHRVADAADCADELGLSADDLYKAAERVGLPRAPKFERASNRVRDTAAARLVREAEAAPPDPAASDGIPVPDDPRTLTQFHLVKAINEAHKVGREAEAATAPKGEKEGEGDA